MKFKKLTKLRKGDKVAILSPSFGAPGMWPEVYELGLKRLRDVFELEPIEYPTTRKVGASGEERSRDLVAAFEDPNIKAIVTTIGGDDQVSYVKNLPRKIFADNPKPFFGFSDNSHIMNHLWLNGVGSYYGGALFTQYARGGGMDDFTVEYLKKAFFGDGMENIAFANEYNDIALDWSDQENLNRKRLYEKNEGWYWDGAKNVGGVTWGGCLESIDEMILHDVYLPSDDDFKNAVLFTETSEEVPSVEYVERVYRALGEKGILGSVKAILVGRPKAWDFNNQKNTEEKSQYRQEQRNIILETVRSYNDTCPVVQNMDFGHTDPQICLPMGSQIRMNSSDQSISIHF